MGGIFYFLIIATILVISYSRQAKRSGKETPRQPDYIPDGKQPQAGSGSPYNQSFPPFLQPAKPLSKQQVSPVKTETAARRTYVSVQSTSSAVSRRPAATTRQASEAAPQSPYSFRCVEEVRRAFVWMEILQRKY